ncbi:MAG: TIR domain-containing protein [Anaerolineaceae bacterium]|nr:TIR domain-containing protein [Anaerolineaceae bacterium]
MAHIFISYSKQDIEFMRYLKVLLEAEGYSVWVDEARLTPSVRWWKTIEQNVMECSAFVIVMSPSASDSDWVEREILLAESESRPIIPVLLTGNPWPRLANIQYEDMRAGVRAKLSSRFIGILQSCIGRQSQSTATSRLIFRIEEGNVTQFEADVMAFKYARSFHGADKVVARLLEQHAHTQVEELAAKLGEYKFVPTHGAIAAGHVLYIGTPGLGQFRYPQIQEFASSTLQILAKVAPETQHLAMTVHGPGFGLDENESITAQFLGYLQVLQSPMWSMGLEQITIVERNAARVEQMRNTIDTLLKDVSYATPLDNGWGYWLNLSTPAAEIPVIAKAEKAYAFVIMPVDSDDDDLYIYGIQTPIHAHGLLCERSAEAFDGSLDAFFANLESRINQATAAVIDLTKADESVYLQLGYVWRAGIPTILLLKENETFYFELPPNVIRYRKIRDAETAISGVLDTLKADGKI